MFSSTAISDTKSLYMMQFFSGSTAADIISSSSSWANGSPIKQEIEYRAFSYIYLKSLASRIWWYEVHGQWFLDLGHPIITKLQGIFKYIN